MHYSLDGSYTGKILIELECRYLHFILCRIYYSNAILCLIFQIAISTDLVGGDLFTISVWDVVTGNVLTSYKSVSSLVVPPRCIDLVGDHFLLCTYQSSPILNVWSLAKKDHLHSKMILPGVAGAVAVSSCGAYCIVGIDSKIYIWQVS